MQDYNDKPEWFCIVKNINAQRIKRYNIFNHIYFLQNCDKAWIDNHNDSQNGFLKFEKDVKENLLYCFWSKCEWEILIYGFPFNDKFKPLKLDIYDQVTMNWDNFINYLWRYYKYDTPKRVLNER